MAAPIPKGKWSWNYDYCFHCGTTETKHKGWGLCLRCWDKNRADNPKRKAVRLKASRSFAKRHKWKDKFKEDSRKRAREYYRRNKDNPEFMAKARKQNLDSYYRLKETEAYTHKQRVWQRNYRLRKYYKEFIKGNPFYLKKFSGGMQFRCDGCSKNCSVTSPVKPYKTIGVETENNLIKLKLFKEVLIKNCNKNI